ncbi:MAG TPA: ABC transporter ATP-binding protein [Pyrinomonadaceae bacterium]|jgi:lipopolysaccharide transport system ATP-binding protein|nr:ABC transporter ATP-binding protein [Pyrinomonadaceae bacterium]
MEPIIRVQDLGKQYHIGGPAAAYSTLRETIMELARKPLRSLTKNGNASTIWALKDVDFEIAPGEIVGIIGRNGAGKSTLLKILSRIVEPTEGRVELYGRVASLLEVGTGFHPELSGRENIFLNGSILGMTRREIERKFDEIVSFAEVEKFIDTPVKRYSSGMYVRLAFAVAAHLEPEILVVDEVLAVGDHRFQQKCLNKMHDVATHGRTILFVSHNMGAVSRLCQRTILLNEGRVVSIGPTPDVVQLYTISNTLGRAEYLQSTAPQKGMNLRRVAILKDGELRADVGYHETFSIHLEYEVNRALAGGNVGIGLFSADGTCVFASADFDAHPELLEMRDPGYYHADIEIPAQWLTNGRYVVHAYLSSGAGTEIYDNPEALVFTIVDTGTPGSKYGVRRSGVLQPILEWKTERTS